MEASRKFSVMEKLDEFKRRYPREKFIWVNAPLETAGEWPEHYGLGARTFKVPTDNMMTYTSPKTQKTTRNNGWIFELAGNWMLMKAAKLQLMHDAGVLFARDQMRRLDDGHDPKVYELEGSAAMLTISGLVVVTGRKRIDLNLTTRVNAEFLAENCETKLELRLGMKLLGIPQVFTMEELKAKEFVTFCVFSAPHAVTPQERLLVLQHHLGIYGPAFGGAAAALPSGPTVGVRMIEAGDEHPDEEPDEIPRAEVVEESTEVKRETLPDEPEPIDYDFLNAVGKLKEGIIKILGSLQGAGEYYRILETHGVKHCNEPMTREKKIALFRDLEAKLKLLKANVPSKEPEKPKPAPRKEKPVAPPSTETDPLVPFIEMRRASLNRMPLEQITNDLDEMFKSYPKEDPLKIIPRFSKASDKAGLIDIAMELFDWQVRESARIREQHNAKREGEL